MQPSEGARSTRASVAWGPGDELGRTRPTLVCAGCVALSRAAPVGGCNFKSVSDPAVLGRIEVNVAPPAGGTLYCRAGAATSPLTIKLTGPAAVRL